MQYRSQGRWGNPRPRPSLCLSLRSVPTAALTLLAAVTPAYAANALASAQVQGLPTFETAAVHVTTTGDDNSNATGTIQYRVQGQTRWQSGHPLVRVLPTRLSSLLINLREGTTYQVLVTLKDPDSTVAPVQTTFTTRVTPRSVAYRTLYVSTSGSAAPTGSLAAPFGTITAAFKAAKPGDTILLLPGTYREEFVNYSNSGAPGAPITVKPAGPGVYIRGDMPGPANPHTTPLWARQSDGLYALRLPSMTGYVAAGNSRLYHFSSRTALQSARAAGQSGWWLDADNTLYVTLAGNVSPDTVSMHVSALKTSFHFLNVHDIIIDGLDIGYFGLGYSNGIYLYGSVNVTVRNCTIHHANYGIFLKDASNTLIEQNNISDPGMELMDWGLVKGSDAEGVGVMIGNAGADNVVRRNNIHDTFNGVASIGGDTTSLGTDVYYNWFHDIGDDGIEPEGSGVDFRAWCNTVRNTMNSVSLAPIETGPAWILYNTLSEFKQAGLKVSNSGYGPVLAYHNTMVTTRPDTDGLTPWNAIHNFTLRNNILYSTRYVVEDMYTTPAAHTSFDYDLLKTSDSTRFVKWGDTRYASLGQFQATGQERHGVAGDPQFASLSGGDFRLAPTSPARHRAVIIPGINDFLGTTPDIGAMQMGG